MGYTASLPLDRAAQPQNVGALRSDIWTPDNVWWQKLPFQTVGRAKIARGGAPGGAAATPAGGSAANNGSSQYQNFAVSLLSAYPIIQGAVFQVTEISTGVQTAVGYGGATLSSGLYGGVGQYTATKISGWGRHALGGSDGAVEGPNAVIGQVYSVVYISRNATTHVLYVNGVRYSGSTDTGFAGDSVANFVIGAAVRNTTPVFYGKQNVLLGFIHQGIDPGDPWLEDFSLTPWAQLFVSPKRRIWVGASASGSPYTLPAEAGSVALTGQDVALTAARRVTAEAGSIALTGQNVALAAARKITAEAGAIALTGIDANLLAARKITAEAGAHTLTGIDVGLTAARKLLADTGAIVLTGQDVALIYTAAGAYTLAAGAGSFALTGQDAGLTAARRIALEAGAFVLTGVDVGLVYAATGSYSLTAEAGQFVLTGQNVTLDYFSVVRAARARATGSITESNQRPTAAAPRRSSGAAPSRPSRRS